MTIKTQVAEILDFVKQKDPHHKYIEVVCNNIGVHSFDDDERSLNETDIVLSSLLNLLGLVAVKVTFGWHGDNYKKVQFFFVTQQEFEELDKKFQEEP